MLWLTSIGSVKALIFILVFAYFSGLYFFFNDYSESLSTILGTYFSILGVGLALYVALWVYGIEQRKEGDYTTKLEAENSFYRRMVIHDTYGLMTSIRMMQFHWPIPEEVDPKQQDERLEKRNFAMRLIQDDINLRCSDLEKINNNVYAPPDIRQKVLLICRQATKTINHPPGMTKDVFERIEELLDTKYMSGITDTQILKWIRNMRWNIEESE